MPSNIIRIQGCVKNYAWGGKSFIPSLLKTPNTENRPHAELWMGTHKDGPCMVKVNGAEATLRDAISQDPGSLLGKRSISRFGAELPYLFKVLDAAEPLSIQVHPSKKLASEGYYREEKAGTPEGSRSYKDPNHKPEVHVPVTDFWMLHGFRPKNSIYDTICDTPEFTGFVSKYEERGLSSLYSTLMQMDQGSVDDRLGTLLRRLNERYQNGAYSMNTANYWACKAAEKYPVAGGHFDKGIFSIYLMNLLHLRPGQATFQPTGTPHAYLFGTTMELMACSDNVLRCGLTPKKVDEDELLKAISFRQGLPATDTGLSSLSGSWEKDVEWVYKTPMKEGQLSRIVLGEDCSTFRSDEEHSFDMFLVNKGAAHIYTKDDSIDVEQGDVIGITAGNHIGMSSDSAEIFRVTVPE